MVDLTEITVGPARLQLAPELGGGIARLDVGDRPVLRPWIGDESNPFSLACNVLVPFSNRISQGGFEWNGTHHPMEPNLPGEAFAIHGDGFQKTWSVEMASPGARLSLEGGAIGPWRYAAHQEFSLSENGLRITLTVTNTGPEPLPFGYGFHPWFPRCKETRLSFAAKTVWMEDARYLPTHERLLDDAVSWDFAAPRPLPDTWINNGFVGWTGAARIAQGPNAVSCTVTASDNLETALVYSPNADAEFFCFEPVSHPVDAFHLPDHPGLHELRPGETLTAGIHISWRSE